MKKKPLGSFRVFIVGLLVIPFMAAGLGCAAGGMPMATSTPAQLSVGAAKGRPATLHSGSRFGYWLWQDDDGTWHLRTTSASEKRVFKGRLRPGDGGSITHLQPAGIDRKQKDVLLTEGRDVVFRFFSEGKIDGFDFRVTGNVCLEADLRIDGDGDPGKINLGKSITKPGNSHFVLCP